MSFFLLSSHFILFFPHTVCSASVFFFMSIVHTQAIYNQIVVPQIYIQQILWIICGCCCCCWFFPQDSRRFWHKIRSIQKERNNKKKHFTFSSIILTPTMLHLISFAVQLKSIRSGCVLYYARDICFCYVVVICNI